MIKLLCDTASDFTLEEAKSLGIELTPMTVNFGEEVYKDVFDLSNEEFFKKLVEGKSFPHTSQISPFQFEEKFEEMTKDGSEVICITMSSKLSGTYESGVAASKNYPGVRIIDSLNVTVGEKILALLALRLIKENKTLDEIADHLNKAKLEISLVALLDTFEYLRKGGRIPSAVAYIGNALHLKPAIEIRDGIVNFLGIARGSKNGNNKIREKAAEYGGIDYSLPVAVAYSGLSDELIERYITDSPDLCEDRSLLNKTLIGSTIGTHIGPGAIAIAFFKKRDEKIKGKKVKDSIFNKKPKEEKKAKPAKAKEKEITK